MVIAGLIFYYNEIKIVIIPSCSFVKPFPRALKLLCGGAVSLCGKIINLCGKFINHKEHEGYTKEHKVKNLIK